jgi:hypothetical protein
MWRPWSKPLEWLGRLRGRSSVDPNPSSTYGGHTGKAHGFPTTAFRSLRRSIGCRRTRSGRLLLRGLREERIGPRHSLPQPDPARLPPRG